VVACLDAIEQAENGRERPLAAPQDRPSYAREPFGSGVRVHQRLQPHDTVGSWTSPPGTAEVVEQSTRRLMREVSSNDSVRTARLEDLFPEPLLSASAPSTGRPRFCDPSVFDAFHRHNTRASAPSHVEETAPPDAASPHGIPFGHHGRLDSSTSIASNRSGASSHVSAHEITVVPAVDDDPRFVIWGMKGAKASSEVPLRSTDAPPRRASPASSATDSPKRSHDRRRSSVRSDERSWPASSLRNSTNSTTARNTRERVLMAATAERLVAELTSNISPDLLAAFFITYRNFMEPIDLLHLLLARFEWAMPPPEHWPTTATGLTASTSSLSSLSAAAAEDEALRRIVRVRTFVVLRYWLLNHFMRDYYPSHELRTTLTTWLNSSARDSRFRASPKDVRLIKALKKTVRKCKDAFILGKSRESMLPPQRSPVLVAGEEEGEDEVDLDDAVRADRDAVIAAGKTAADSHSRGLSTPLAPSIYSRDEESYPLPDDDESRPRGPVARRLSSAVGTFGRIKRKLRDGARKYAAPATSDTLPFGATSAELSRDLLRDESRLSRYLQQLGIELLPSETSAVSTPAISTTCSGVKLLAPEMDVPVSRLDDPPLAGSGRTEQELDTPVPDLTASIGRGINTPPLPVTSGTPDADGPFRGLFANDAVIPLAPIFTLAPGAFGPLTTFGRPESVRIELDDLEDSSDDDEDVIEAKRALKRQPPAPMFAHTRPWHSSDESSQDHGLLGSQTRKTHGLSELFVDDEAGFEKSELVTVIPNFVLDGLVDSDDEDEPGDVEAALRRLEGLVDESKERKHALRVQQQMEKSRKLEEDARARQQALEQAAGLSAQASRGPSDTPSALVDSPMEAINVGLLPSLQGLQSAAGSTQSVATSPAWMGSVANIRASPEGTVRRATPPTVTPAPPTHKPNLTARLFGAPSVEKKAPTTASVSAVSPPGHRAFVLYFRTDVLARQFALIERDLLRLVRYQELADGSWRHYIGETDVLDWDGHVKDRRRADVAALESGQRASSAVQDVIARFNLTANWVTSEVRSRLHAFPEVHS
jgi:GDP/GTP exchange factor required for growth at low temperature